MEADMNRCGACIELVETETDHSVNVAGHLFEGEIRVARCATCGGFRFARADLDRFDLAVVERLVTARDFPHDALPFVLRTLALDGRNIVEQFGFEADEVASWAYGETPVDGWLLHTFARMARERLEG